MDFEPVFDAVVADEASAPFPTTFDDFTGAGAALDAMSVYDWIESRVPGGHGSPLGMLLDTAYAIEYGADTSEQASLNLIYLLAFQPEPSGLSVFGESDERFHIRGGNQQLPEAIADHLGVGDAVVTGRRLVKIKETSAGRYRLTFEHGSSTTDVTADYVVLAIPFAVLRHVDLSEAGFDRAQAPGDRGAGTGEQRQDPAPVHRSSLGADRPVARRVQRLELRRHRLPGLLGGDARAAGRQGDPRRLLGRQRHRRLRRATRPSRPPRTRRCTPTR